MVGSGPKPASAHRHPNIAIVAPTPELSTPVSRHVSNI